MSQHNLQTMLHTALMKSTGQIFHTPEGYVFGWGTTVGNSVENWAPNALFVHTDGTGATRWYFNQGSSSTAVWSTLGSMPIADAASYFTSDSLEGALANIGAHITTAAACIPIPLLTLRETTNFDVGNIAANGGLLASDTTPILEAINAATDGCQRVSWVADDVDQIMFQAVLPPDLNAGADLVLHARMAASGATDTITVTVDSFFNEGDTKVTDTFATVNGTTYAEKTCTIAAADVSGQTVTCGLTPGAHANDALYLTALWFEYTRNMLTG